VEPSLVRPHPQPFSRYTRSSWSPFSLTADTIANDPLQAREIEQIVGAARESDAPVHWRRLAHDVHAGRWGPGRFRAAMRAAERGGVLRRAGRGTYTAEEQQRTS
jgi:hypothetical protein